MEHCKEATASGFKFRKHNKISDTNLTTSSHLPSALLDEKKMGWVVF
jgi:hypothetical protein